VRVLLSWAEGRVASEVPLSVAEIRGLFRFLHRELRATPLYQNALKDLSARAVGSVSLHFCDDVEMRALQKRYRKLDRTTDILSFPTREVPGASEMLARLPPAERSWGDLVVSMPTVERGARRGRRPVSVELTEVLVHGFLHLLGMDHIVGKGITPRHAREMKSLQKKLFRAWKTSH
jgi:rRNA maturation RNase YbeY